VEQELPTLPEHPSSLHGVLMIAYLKCFICVARNSGVILHNYIDDLLRTVYFVANYNIPIEFLWSSVNRLTQE
jgi:hypothetical protein